MEPDNIVAPGRRERWFRKLRAARGTGFEANSQRFTKGKSVDQTSFALQKPTAPEGFPTRSPSAVLAGPSEA